MASRNQSTVSREIPIRAFSGWLMLVLHVLWLFGAFAMLFYSGPRHYGPGVLLAFLGFAIAFMVKTPVFPFHTWLPDAHTEAPTAGSIDLAEVRSER